MIQTAVENDELLATATEEDLGVALFVGKLRQLTKAGMDLGVTPELLETVLLMINHFYPRLAVPPEGAPH